MIRVGATTLVRKFGHYQDIALKEPAEITSNGRERVVLISADEYRRLKKHDRRVLGLEDFTAEEIAAIARSEAPSESARFDREAE
jgi:prevent-host-death family protein